VSKTVSGAAPKVLYAANGGASGLTIDASSASEVASLDRVRRSALLMGAPEYGAGDSMLTGSVTRTVARRAPAPAGGARPSRSSRREPTRSHLDQLHQVFKLPEAIELGLLVHRETVPLASLE
jgi:hypothetical protein